MNSSLQHLIRPRHSQIDLFLGLTETVALISNRFNGLAQITPGLNRSASRRRVFLLAPMRCGNQPEGAGNIETVVAGKVNYL